MKWNPTALKATNCLKDLSLFGIVTAVAVQLFFKVYVSRLYRFIYFICKMFMFYHLLWQKCLSTYTLIYTIYLHCNTASILIQLVCVSNVISRCLGTFLGVLIITMITTNVNITGTDWNLNIGRAVTFPEFQYQNLNSQDGDAEVKRNKLSTDSTHLNKLKGTWVGLSWFVLASGLIWFPINVVTFSVSWQ